MTITNLSIHRLSEENFEFIYRVADRNPEVVEERSKVVRFLDEAIDSLMLMANHLKVSPMTRRTVIRTGDDEGSN